MRFSIYFLSQQMLPWCALIPSLTTSMSMFEYVCLRWFKWFTLQRRGLSRIALLHAWPLHSTSPDRAVEELLYECFALLSQKYFYCRQKSLQIYFHVRRQSWLRRVNRSFQWRDYTGCRGCNTFNWSVEVTSDPFALHIDVLNASSL